MSGRRQCHRHPYHPLTVLYFIIRQECRQSRPAATPGALAIRTLRTDDGIRST